MNNPITIDLRLDNYLKIGTSSYSGVFTDKINNQVIKVFLKPASSRRALKFTPSGIIYEDKDIPYQVCKNEIAAYQIIQENKNSTLFTNYTPTFYGQCQISLIIDKSGCDISDSYNLHCNYRLELLTGNEYKWAACPIEKDIQKNIEKLFYDLDIMYIIDSSVFITNNSIKIFDFAKECLEIGDSRLDLM